MRVSDLIPRSIAKRCVSKDDATELESALEVESALASGGRPSAIRGDVFDRRRRDYSAAIISIAFAGARWRAPQLRMAAMTGTKLLPLRVRRYSTLGGTTP